MTSSTFPTTDQQTRGIRPSLRAVLLEQLGTTGIGLRWPALAAALAGAVVMFASLLAIVNRGAVINLHHQPTVLAGLVGALLPLIIWLREERFGPGFFWTVPVDRRRHALVKVLAGWIWLIAGVVLFSSCLLILALTSGGDVLPAETLKVLPTPARPIGTLDPASLRSVLWTPGALIWAVPFGAATATYLLSSALMVGVRYPLRWMIGVVLCVPILSAAADVLERVGQNGGMADAMTRMLPALLKGRYGLDALLTARTATLDHRATLATGERVSVWLAVPDLGDWLVTTLLWTTAGLLLLWIAASRHREERRG